jgi:creatinine amidohydrolase
VREDKVANFNSEAATIEREFKWLRPDRPAGFGWMTQDLNEQGALGDARDGSREKGEAAIEHGARTFIELLNDVNRFDLERLKDGPAG